MVTSILIPIVSLGALAFILAVCIAFISKKFYYQEDPLITTVIELLPGVNCGACGFPGCSGFAKAIVETRDSSLVCPVGGSELSETLGQTLGMKMAEVVPVVCTVICQGNYTNARKTAEYLGIQDCWAASQAFNGTKVCPFACIGLGSCIYACKYGAMKIKDGIIVVDEDRCVGCGACIKECPKRVLVMQKRKQENRYYVSCRSTDKGGISKKYCDVSCIGCQKCVKVCEYDAVKVVDFCAQIDQTKCTSCGKCFEACPTKAIMIKEKS